MSRLRLGFAALAATLLFAALPARADTITYNFELAIPNGLPVNQLVLYAAGAGSEDLFVAPVTLAPTGIQSLTHTVGFTPTSALILGINPATLPEKPHVVMFADTAFAASAFGIKWSSVFDSSAPDYVRHSAVIALIQDAYAGDPSGLLGFLRGPQGTAAAFDPAGPFSVVVFSAGSNGGGSVPEPATFMLLAVGVAGLCLRRRR